MGFDANSAGQPLVNVHRKTTQVNLWMVAGVVVFLLLGGFVILWLSAQHGPDAQHTLPEQQAKP